MNSFEQNVQRYGQPRDATNGIERVPRRPASNWPMPRSRNACTLNDSTQATARSPGL
jgi:hypothetical protein